jgi:hypothetical protein
MSWTVRPLCNDSGSMDKTRFSIAFFTSIFGSCIMIDNESGRTLASTASSIPGERRGCAWMLPTESGDSESFPFAFVASCQLPISDFSFRPRFSSLPVEWLVVLPAMIEIELQASNANQ